MKLKVFYDKDTDILSLWNGRPASEADDVAEHLVADFDDDGEVVGFTLEHASELLRAHLSDGDEETERLQQTFGDLLYCHKNIQKEFDRIGNPVLEEFLGVYNTKKLREGVRKYGDGYTLRSIPRNIQEILDVDVLVIVVMNSPSLNENSDFNQFTPLHSIPYWRDGKGLEPDITVNGQKYKLHFMVWEQECSVHGETTSYARKNQSLLQRHYPKLYKYLQEDRQKSEQFMLYYIDWCVAHKKQVVILTNAAKRSFNQPIQRLLTFSQVKHIPTKLFGANRRIMERISNTISVS